MTGHIDFDDDYVSDGEYYHGAEEPDCFPCMQSRVVDARRWSRRPTRPCPACSGGDWWDRSRVLNWWRWRRHLGRWWWHRLRYHRRGGCRVHCFDEAPF